ncbi:MAG TPA: hypothetical protein VIB48_09920 [Acidimicrobiia bacterium]|jgi:hypothetical protein
MPDRDDDSLESEGVPDLEGPLPEKELTGDPQEGVSPPNYSPKASTDWGVTVDEQRRPEPLDVRIRRERPDFGARDVGFDPDEWQEPVRVVDDADTDVGLRDDEGELVALEGEEGADDLSAEESALHVEQE